ncbi:MAG TPA: hypothetical protein VLA84_22545 [Microcoleus sp.]|nr:hypothetical protein [Microcoleus sp.]
MAFVNILNWSINPPTRISGWFQQVRSRITDTRVSSRFTSVGAIDLLSL